MTLPKEAREHLRVKAGDKVKIFNLPDGTVVLLPVRPISSLRGILKSPLGRPATIEEMNEGIVEGALASLGITPYPSRAKLKGRARRATR
jgi:AbrB family looped-hinge helix DNA binding protein